MNNVFLSILVRPNSICITCAIHVYCDKEMFLVLIIPMWCVFQVCRNINRIKVCMETGNTVVLLNLENLYESLYDALNQVRIYQISNFVILILIQWNEYLGKLG